LLLVFSKPGTIPSFKPWLEMLSIKPKLISDGYATALTI
jgi:hypothetical protein